MASTVTLFENVLPTSLGQELSYKPPAAAPVANRQRILLPPQQGANFAPTAGSTIRFAIPSINKLLDTSAGIQFNFNVTLSDQTKSYLSEGASSVIQRLRVLTTGDQQLEDLSAYNVWSRINSNYTIPAYQKSTALGICQGYASAPAGGVYGAPAGRGNGHYSIPLHSMILSNAKWLPLKHMGGLIVEITLAPARECLIRDPSSSNLGYTVSQASLSFDTIELTDGQKMALDNAVRQAGGVMLTGRSWSVKYPAFSNATGSIVVSDRHSSQTGLVLAFRSNTTLGDQSKDAMQFAKTIDSAHIRNGGEMLSARPVVFAGTDVCEAFVQLLRAYGNHAVGAGLTQDYFADSSGNTTGEGKGSFALVQTFETSSLVSGSSTARRSGVDIEVVTTGSSTPNEYSAIAFVSYNKCASFNIDGSVDVYE